MQPHVGADLSAIRSNTAIHRTVVSARRILQDNTPCQEHNQLAYKQAGANHEDQISHPRGDSIAVGLR